MPILTIFGIPTNKQMSPIDFRSFEQEIRETTASVEALKIKPVQVTVYMPADNLVNRPNKDIYIKVETLFDRPERTMEVKKELADKLIICVHQGFPNATLIECLVDPIVGERVFASGKLMPDGSFVIS